MSTLTPIQTTANLYAPNGVSESLPPSGKNFPHAMTQAPSTWLTTAEAANNQRPNIKAFMDRTGANFNDASELLYGVVGSNTDVRNWAAIMASSDPITAARQATGQMYGRTAAPPRSDATYLGTQDTLARSGNFAVRLLKNSGQQVIDQGVKLIDAQGLLIRDAGTSPEQIARQAWLFGFDTQSLAPLAAAASTISPELGRAVKTASQQSTATVQLTPTATPMSAVTTSPAVGTVSATINPNPTNQDRISRSSELRPSESNVTTSTTPIGFDLALPTEIALPANLATDYLALFESARVSVEQPLIEAAPAIDEPEPTPQDDGPALANATEDATHQSLGYVDSTRYLNAMFNT
jgi:hypothetical protein